MILLTKELTARLEKRDLEVIAQLERLFKVFYEAPQYLSQYFITILEQIQEDLTSQSIETLEFLYYFGKEVDRFISTVS